MSAQNPSTAASQPRALSNSSHASQPALAAPAAVPPRAQQPVQSARPQQFSASGAPPVSPHPAPLARQLPCQPSSRIADSCVLQQHPPTMPVQRRVAVPQNALRAQGSVPSRSVHNANPAANGAVSAYNAALTQMLQAAGRLSPPVAVPGRIASTLPSSNSIRLPPNQPFVPQRQLSSVPMYLPTHPVHLHSANSVHHPPTVVSTAPGAPHPVASHPVPVQRPPASHALQTAIGGQGAQQSKQFSRSRLVPRPREPTLMHYYERLDKTIQEATEFSRNLRFPPDSPPPDPRQIARVVAHDLQGVLGSEVPSVLAKHASNNLYIEAVSSKVAGDFVEYGVSGTHLSYIADALMATTQSLQYTMLPQISLQEKHPHPMIERARVRVFEAEITHLPLDFVEKLVKTRRSMRRFKSRIELHVRIILALEGKGRRVGDAQLDRLKLQLEKADQQAENERKRRMAAEAAKLEKERRAKEAAKQSEKIVLREKELKKRRRQEHAQASFMKRFVKPKVEERQREDSQEVRYVPRKRSGHYAQEVAEDPDVMSVDWWLRSELQFVSVSRLDELLREGTNDLKSHLRACAVRREAAEKTIHSVLQDYRARRRVPCDDRYPRFARKRTEVRGRRKQGPIKLLQFDENYRPAYYGTFRKSKVVSGRRPFRKDSGLDYDNDSEAEWEEEEGEDIQDVEDDKELASEDAELRKLYGSDDEDDDDFLDDDEAGDDDDDDEEGDDGGGQNSDGDKKEKEGEVVDLTKNTTMDSQKARDIVRVKRRKSSMGSVVIDGVNFSGASKLDAYPVSTFANSKPIQMFNPFVFSASDIVAEHLKAKVPSTRTARPSNIDEKAKLDLAVALVNDGSNRDRIVYQFCESRRTRGLNVPAKSEVVRAISEMATREKRDGDTRAVWHLNDAKLERMVQQMGAAPRAIPVAAPITTPVSATK